MKPILAAIVCASAFTASDAGAQSACSRQSTLPWHHALFGDAVKKPAADGVVRVYFDRLGAVYPNGSVAPRNVDFTAAATLECYYSGHPEAFAHLLHETGVSRSGKFAVDWDAAQDAIIAAVAARLNRLLRGPSGEPKTLVVLIHGFRVNNAATTFDSARMAVRRHVPADQVVFLEVNWDGLTGLYPVWFAARTNAPLAGLELRRILTRVQPESPIRIITHSLGASVAASALWNRHRDLDRGAEGFRRYFQHVGGSTRYPLRPQGDIRLGMFVPAISGGAMPAPGTRLGSLHRVIIGQNANDLAVQKLMRVAKLAGSTALAVNDGEFCEFVNNIFTPDAFLIDFKHSTRWQPLALESHDFENYIREGSDFFQDLLMDATVDPHGRKTGPGRARAVACPGSPTAHPKG